MHDDAGGQGHQHGGGRGTARAKPLVIALVLAAGYMVAEVVGGIAANSLALLADAGHMLSDVAALGLSLFAMWYARRPADARRTFGYHRAEILAAMANGAALVAISIYIWVEAVRRFREPPEVQGAMLMGIAIGGLVVNLVGMWVMRAGRGESLNVRGAWLHAMTDALGSVGAIAAGALVWALGWEWADPAISILIGVLVVYSAWSLLKQSVAVLMEGTPEGIDLGEVREAMRSVAGVEAVHDLHVWSITTGMNSLSAHVVLGEDIGIGQERLLKDLKGVLHERFGIDHTTIQVEPRRMNEPETHR